MYRDTYGLHKPMPSLAASNSWGRISAFKAFKQSEENMLGYVRKLFLHWLNLLRVIFSVVGGNYP